MVNQLGKYGDGLLYLFKIALFTCSVLKYSWISVYLFKRTVYHYTVCMTNNECSITLDVAGVPFLTHSVQPSHRLFTGQQLHHLSTGAVQQPYFAILENTESRIRARIARSVGSARAR